MVPGGDLAKTTRAACLIANHSGIKGLLKQQEKIFSKMYSKRPFVHWYSGEGMEEGEFGEGCELLLDLIKVYEQVELDTGKEEEEG
jgi:tubulin alpha